MTHKAGDGAPRRMPWSPAIGVTEKRFEAANHVMPNVDLILLTRDAGPIHPEVQRGIHEQVGVQLTVHRVIGESRQNDACRWDTIARARNEGRLLGRSPWLMFLDDDVVLEPACVAALVDGLTKKPIYGALAADYLGQGRQGEIARHVSMGATLFRRAALEQIRCTWREGGCECQCCCDDLRRLHWGIDYLPAAMARHLPKAAGANGKCGAAQPASTKAKSVLTGYVLAGFDRRHLHLFRQQFLPSLRIAGNKEQVLALAVGLYQSERERFQLLAGVTPYFKSDNGQTVARRRLYDFAEIAGGLPPTTPIAYWDAGDVIFQGRLQTLWEQVEANPNKLLVASEPVSHPQNKAVVDWTEGIVDSNSRRRVRETLYHRAWLNGGFVAGTARTLIAYFHTVADWYDTPVLNGSGDWGDQLALNLYCHSDPQRWHQVAEGWNYCLCLRNRKTVYRGEDGRFIDRRGVAVHVVHGNASTLNSIPFRRQTL